MSPVLSKRVVKDLIEELRAAWPNETLRQRMLFDELNRSIKQKRSVKASRTRRVAKKKTKREEMAELRAEVFARSGGKCEVCGAEATDLEHAFGRVRVKQAPSNCLSVCRPCHVERTNNRPSALHWWGMYAGIFEGRGDRREAMAATDLAIKHMGAAS